MLSLVKPAFFFRDIFLGTRRVFLFGLRTTGTHWRCGGNSELRPTGESEAKLLIN